jgi:hypothetical protein
MMCFVFIFAKSNQLQNFLSCRDVGERATGETHSGFRRVPQSAVHIHLFGRLEGVIVACLTTPVVQPRMIRC